MRITGLKMIVFREIRRALFSLNTRFEIRTFALLPTKKGLLSDSIKGQYARSYHLGS